MLRRVIAGLGIAFGVIAAPASASLPSGQWPLATGGSLRAPLAWQQSRGGGVVVAVLDTGVQIDRAELRGHIWTNPGEVPGNGIDDDGDGVVDDVHGWDFADGDADTFDAFPVTRGTLVSGLVAGSVTGLAPGATIMPLKVFSDSGSDPDFE